MNYKTMYLGRPPIEKCERIASKRRMATGANTQKEEIAIAAIDQYAELKDGCYKKLTQIAAQLTKASGTTVSPDDAMIEAIDVLYKMVM